MSLARVARLERQAPRVDLDPRMARMFSVLSQAERRAYFIMARHADGSNAPTQEQRIFVAERVARLDDEQMRGFVLSLGKTFERRLADHERDFPQCVKCARFGRRAM